MSPAEIERELYDSNGIEKNTRALQPWILFTRNALEYVNQGRIMIAFRNETAAEYYKTYGIFFMGDHWYARGYVETKRINKHLSCHELTHPTGNCSRKPRCVHCTSTGHTSADYPGHVRRVRERRKVPGQ